MGFLKKISRIFFLQILWEYSIEIFNEEKILKKISRIFFYANIL